MNSKHWNDMFILHENKHISPIISYTKPPSIECPDDFYITHEIDDEDSFIQFINQNNRTSTGNITMLTHELLKSYIQLNSLFLILKERKNNTIVGTLITIPIPIHFYESINNNEINDFISEFSTCTTFLCISEHLRKKGLAIFLMKKMTEYGYDKGLLTSYYVVPFKIGQNSIPIFSWYRPIKLDRARKIGFECPSFKKNNDRTERRDRLRYQIRLSSRIKIERIDEDRDFDFYFSLINNKKLYYSPTKDHLRLWTSQFPTFIVIENGRKIGLFSYYDIQVKLMKTGEISKIAHLLFCQGKQPETIQACLYNSKEYDVLYGYRIGDITDEIINQINGFKTDRRLWLSFYNIGLKFNENEISIPFL